MKRLLMISLIMVFILTALVPAVLAKSPSEDPILAAEKCKTYSNIKFCWKGQITSKGEVQICGQVEKLGWKCKTIAKDTTKTVDDFCAHMNPS